MKLISTILFLLFAWISSVAFATEDDKIIKSSRDFSLRCRSLGNLDESEKRVSATVYGAYSSKDQEIKISIDMSTDSAGKFFKLKYPLDFEVFKQKFDSLLNERKDDSLFVFYGSHLEVFYWIVTITEDHNLPLAGTLTTSQYVMISSSNESQESYTERMTKIKTEIEDLELKDIQYKSANFKENIESLKGKINTYNISKNSKVLDSLLKEARQVFPQSIKISDKNIIGYLDSILEKYPSYPNTSEEVKKARTELNNQTNEIETLHIRKVSHVQYQFEKGYLEKIQVYIENHGTENLEIFENSYPIGFSSISNYKNFTATRLFRRSSKFENDVKDNYIVLSDIIKLYENELNLATRDYSPGDTTITVFPSANPIVRLTKQRSFYIIDGKTFTDVTGLSENSPNGLVQVELSRRFNLWTHRVQVRSSNNFGCVNYVNAKVNFSKIENKLKGLPLRNQLIVENNSIVSPSYATNLDYLRYENLGITMDVNAFLFDAPDFKYTLFIDAGIHYGHTPIIDSVYEISQGVATTTSNEPNKLDAHNFTFFPRVKVQLFAERRYGLSMSYQANYTWLFTNNRFKQVMSYSGKGQDLNSLSTNQSAHWSHMIEAAFYVDVNPNSSTGKIFTTARFFFQQGDVNTFYPQILLGYAFNIFK